MTEAIDGSRTTLAPDGSTLTEIFGADPRFGMLAPLTVSSELETPGGVVEHITKTVTATGLDEAAPLDFETLTTSIDLNGNTHTIAFDRNTSTQTETRPLGQVFTRSFDAFGRELTAAPAGETPVVSTYDDKGRLESVVRGSRSETYSYNEAGVLESVLDPGGRTITFTFDDAGRQISQNLPGSRTIATTYDSNGFRTAVTPPGKSAHTFTPSPVNQIATYTSPDAGSGPAVTTLVRNEDGQPDLTTRPDAATLDYQYDGAGRLSALVTDALTITTDFDPTTGQLTDVDTSDGQELSFSYDGGLLTTEAWSGLVSGSVSRAYGATLRILERSVNGANAIAHGYDANNDHIQAGAMTLAYDLATGFIDTTTLGDLSDDLDVNAFGEIESYTARFDGETIFAESFEYDAFGRVESYTETIDDTTTSYDITYDAAGRVEDVAVEDASIASYGYDSNGNRTAAKDSFQDLVATYDAEDRILTAGTAAFAHRSGGEVETKTIGGAVTSYDYNALGQLRSVELPDATVVRYDYDGAGRRVRKMVNDVFTSALVYQDRLLPIAELDEDGDVLSRFVYGARAQVPDYMIQGEDTYRLIADWRGSVRIVVDVSTGDVMQRLDYDTFGQVTDDTNPGFQPFGFAGGLYDAETGLVHFGARDYDATIGRWLTKDPIGFAGTGTNFYAYVGNDPVNFFDPLGLRPNAYFIGGTASVAAGGNATIGGGFVFDTDGNIGFTFNGGGGATIGAGLSGGLSAGSFPGQTTDTFNGSSNSTGASGGEGIIFGADVVTTGELGNETYSGQTVTVGAGIGTPAEVHRTTTHGAAITVNVPRLGNALLAKVKDPLGTSAIETYFNNPQDVLVKGR